MKPIWLFTLCALAAIPAFSQVDLSGEWQALYHEDAQERVPGPDLGDYLGLPINAAARAKAQAWNASLLTLPEWQCRPHPSDYSSRGPANLRLWKEVDTATQQLIAWHTHIAWMAPERTIWMDGRAHPPDYAAHTWQGFSTGKWEGNQLTVYTTHLKPGYIRRNGVPRSEKASMVEHWSRHDNILTLTQVITDPVYLTEPMVRTTDWLADREQEITKYPCEDVVEVPRQLGAVPHHLPGTNEFLSEFPAFYGVPAEAAAGGAETMYPEYMKKIGRLTIQSCQRYCICSGFADCINPGSATNRSQ